MHQVIVALLALVALSFSQTCPAGTCQQGTTCCALGGGQWGCCPYPNADCCTDDSHCCPNGYQCDVSKGQCIKSFASGLLGRSKHIALTKVVAAQASCPAGTCPSTETCCDLGGGQFGCCPYPNADCCTDHAHCCPSGYQCDISKGQCNKGSRLGAHTPNTMKLAEIIH